MSDAFPSDRQWHAMKSSFLGALPLFALIVIILIWRQAALWLDHVPAIVTVQQVDQVCYPPGTVLGTKSGIPLQPCSDFPDNGRRYPVQAGARTRSTILHPRIIKRISVNWSALRTMSARRSRSAIA